jgi:hypothetical protein
VTSHTNYSGSKKKKDEVICAVGGLDSVTVPSDALSSGECWPVKGTGRGWTPIAGMNTPRFGLGLASNLQTQWSKNNYGGYSDKGYYNNGYGNTGYDGWGSFYKNNVDYNTGYGDKGYNSWGNYDGYTDWFSSYDGYMDWFKTSSPTVTTRSPTSDSIDIGEGIGSYYDSIDIGEGIGSSDPDPYYSDWGSYDGFNDWFA